MPVAIYTPLTHRDFKRLAFNTEWTKHPILSINNFRKKKWFKVVILRINCSRICIIHSDDANNMQIIDENNKVLSKEEFCSVVGSRRFPNETISRIQISHAYDTKNDSQILSLRQKNTSLEYSFDLPRI